MVFAIATTGARRLTGYTPSIPWWTLPAVEFLRGRLEPSAVAFEFSTGASTLWLASKCHRVYAVEDDPTWFEAVKSRCGKAPNVQLYLQTGEEPYVESIAAPGREVFDLVSIDGSFRLACFERCLSFLKGGSILVVDNTDSEACERIAERIPEIFPAANVHVFPGYPFGVCHPSETTVCIAE